MRTNKTPPKIRESGPGNQFLMLWVIDFLESWLGPTGGAIVSYLSIIKHFEEFGKGVIDTKDVIYYLSFIGFGLFLSKQSVESHRWRG